MLSQLASFLELLLPLACMHAVHALHALVLCRSALLHTQNKALSA